MGLPLVLALLAVVVNRDHWPAFFCSLTMLLYPACGGVSMACVGLGVVRHYRGQGAGSTH